MKYITIILAWLSVAYSHYEGNQFDIEPIETQLDWTQTTEVPNKQPEIIRPLSEDNVREEFPEYKAEDRIHKKIEMTYKSRPVQPYEPSKFESDQDDEEQESDEEDSDEYPVEDKNSGSQGGKVYQAMVDPQGSDYPKKSTEESLREVIRDFDRSDSPSIIYPKDTQRPSTVWPETGFNADDENKEEDEEEDDKDYGDDEEEEEEEEEDDDYPYYSDYNQYGNDYDEDINRMDQVAHGSHNDVDHDDMDRIKELD